MIKILELSAALDGGGVDKLLFDFCSRLNSEISFDFVVTSEKIGILEEPLKQKGCKIYHIPQMRGNLNTYIRMLKKIMKSGNYDIVHDHMNQAGIGSLWIAKILKVPVRIGHAHTRMINENFMKKIRRKCMTYVLKKCATNFCACGREAGEWLWGKKIMQEDKCFLMRNAINLSQYEFKENERIKLRKKFDLEDMLVIGNVARFSAEKNHRFLLEILNNLINKEIKVKLVLIGRGELEEEIKKMVISLGLEENVLFMGIRKDVSKLLNMMDIFVLPSKYEGFPVTLVEAQANGLPVLVSDAVTDECKLSDTYTTLSLNSSVNEWSHKVIELKGKRSTMDARVEVYDIEKEVKRLKEFYLECLENSDYGRI